MQYFFEFILQIIVSGQCGTRVMRTELRLTTGDTEERRKFLLLPVVTVDHALDSVPQVQDVEVDQQADRDLAQANV